MGRYCEPVWDTDLGRRLYDEGLTYYAIAKRLQIAPTTLHRYAGRYWPPRHGERRQPAPVKPKPHGRRFLRGEASLPPLPSLADDA